jgi:hypothetical protein
MRKAEQCVISGFLSPLEKIVLHYLIKGKQPIIIALVRGMKKQIEPEWLNGIAQGRILICQRSFYKLKKIHFFLDFEHFY